MNILIGYAITTQLYALNLKTHYLHVIRYQLFLKSLTFLLYSDKCATYILTVSLKIYAKHTSWIIQF